MRTGVGAELALLAAPSREAAGEDAHPTDTTAASHTTADADATFAQPKGITPSL
jgi:hypothetical protein